MKWTYNSLRWIWLTVGIVAILGLTGMNIYTLYALRENIIESEKENKKLQIAEFADRVRYRFFKPFYGLGSMDMEHIQSILENKGRFPEEAVGLFKKAAKDSIYKGIYYIPNGSGACREDGNKAILRFNPKLSRFVKKRNYSEVICDGMGIARTRMKVLIADYRYNHKVIFDTNRSMTLALVNLSNRSVIGYLTMPINQQYMINNYLRPVLEKKFNSSSNPGIIVWLRDWTKDRIIASSNPAVTYNKDKVQFIQKFPDLFGNWYLAVAMTNIPTVAASDASVIKNLIVLGVACFLLLGALIFMFITAQREQALAKRQAGFLANVTHELKTPLAVMQAAGENLADGRVEDKDRLKVYGNHIFSEAIRLRKMIDKLLDIAKADARQSLVKPRPIYLNELLNGYISAHRLYIENRGFTLRTSIPDQVPVTMIDAESFETIIDSLLDNAIKYSRDEKFIRLTMTCQNEHILLTLEDRGAGIPRKSVAHVFEKFYRAEDALTAQTKGHGLGLSVVKTLVEQNKGTIEVVSEEGKGTSFFVTFPVLTEPDAQSENISSSPYKISNLTQDSPNYAG